MFTEALFSTAEIQKEPKCPSKDKWIKNDMVYTYNGILLSHNKKWNFGGTTWMNLEAIMLCEISQTEKDKYIISLYVESKKQN